jgi:hypothetical protein
MKNDYDFYNNVAETTTNRLQTERKRTQTAFKRKQQAFQSRKRTQTNAKMNCTINTSAKTAYHIFTNVEFTAVVDIMKYHEYHLFIKYGDKVYMDVRGVGEVVISFDELQKNEQWKELKHYYDLSLLLTSDKHLVAQELRYNSEYSDYSLYDDVRHWYIDTTFIVSDMLGDTGRKVLVKHGDRLFHEKVAYYKINPNDLEKMEYTSQEELEVFRVNYMSSIVDVVDFEAKSVAYDNLVKQVQQ